MLTETTQSTWIIREPSTSSDSRGRDPSRLIPQPPPRSRSRQDPPERIDSGASPRSFPPPAPRKQALRRSTHEELFQYLSSRTSKPPTWSGLGLVLFWFCSCHCGNQSHKSRPLNRSHCLRQRDAMQICHIPQSVRTSLSILESLERALTLITDIIICWHESLYSADSLPRRPQP